MDGTSGDGRVRQVDILITPTTPPNGRRLLRGMAASRPKGTRVVVAPPVRPDAVLMLYGMGGADRYGLALRHVENGGQLVVWDVGYWNRKGVRENRMLRISINGLHPAKYIMQGPLPKLGGRSFRQAGEFQGKADGPIVLVGNGPKSNVIGAEGWAANKSRELRQAFPGRRIVYRPKPKRPHDVGVVCDGVDDFSSIEDLLVRSSLVVCRHSNVAVDACALGVPVVCDDGAAAAIYPARLEEWEQQPSLDTRREFMRRLGWWQWSTIEAENGQVWPWLLGVLDAIREPVPPHDH